MRSIRRSRPATILAICAALISWTTGSAPSSPAPVDGTPPSAGLVRCVGVIGDEDGQSPDDWTDCVGSCAEGCEIFEGRDSEGDDPFCGCDGVEPLCCHLIMRFTPTSVDSKPDCTNCPAGTGICTHIWVLNKQEWQASCAIP